MKNIFYKKKNIIMAKASTSQDVPRQINESIIPILEPLLNYIEKELDKRVNEKFEKLQNSLSVHTTPPVELKKYTPLTTEAEFEEFERKLNNSLSEQQSLMAWYRKKILEKKNVKSSINAMMLSTITKNLALLYSGTGKKSKNGVKKNFSSTEIFKCLEVVIKEKFPDCEREHRLAGQVGRWLSRSFDRDGGKTQKNSRIKKNVS